MVAEVELDDLHAMPAHQKEEASEPAAEARKYYIRRRSDSTSGLAFACLLTTPSS